MDLYRCPTMLFVAGFLGSPRLNLIEGEAARTLGAGIYGIRPEHLSLSPDAGLWRGRVHLIERLDANAMVHLDIPGLGPLVARTRGDTVLVPAPRSGPARSKAKSTASTRDVRPFLRGPRKALRAARTAC
jgi:ABC-type sugar transport system ATPase subunit